MKYQRIKEGEHIFDYGDSGDKFYIILKGRIGIFIPKLKR